MLGPVCSNILLWASYEKPLKSSQGWQYMCKVPCKNWIVSLEWTSSQQTQAHARNCFQVDWTPWTAWWSSLHWASRWSTLRWTAWWSSTRWSAWWSLRWASRWSTLRWTALWSSTRWSAWWSSLGWASRWSTLRWTARWSSVRRGRTIYVVEKVFNIYFVKNIKIK